MTLGLATQRQDLDIHFVIQDPDEDPGIDRQPSRQDVRDDDLFELTQSANIRAAAYRQHATISGVTQSLFVLHRALGRPISLTEPASEKYHAQDGVTTLVNGLTGAESYAEGQWVGAESTGLEPVIDLGEPTSISTVTARSLNSRPCWVHQADRMLVEISDDGTLFEPVE
jgi:hexosaminidase